MTESDHSNVVQMGRHVKSASGLTPTQLEVLLAGCRDKAAARLASVVAAFMPKVDDALFDLADKAVGIGKQTVYFDAMREVRRKRPDIESSFVAAFRRDYDATARGDGDSSPSPVDDELRGLELSLVDNDELEEDLAAGNAAAKIAATCQDELLTLEQRMAVLLNKPELSSAEDPLAPKLICNAFKGATEQVEAETEVKLIVFKLFERAVALEMKSIYEEINRHLAENGVVPKVSKVPRQRPAPGRSSPQPGGTPEEALGDALPDAYPGASPVEATATQDPMGSGITGAGAMEGYPPLLAAHAPTSGDLLALLQQMVGIDAPVSETSGTDMGWSAGPGADLPAGSQPMPGPGAVPAGVPLAAPGQGGIASGSVMPADAGVLHKLTLLQRGEPKAALDQTSELDAASLRAGNVNVLRELRSSGFANSMNVVDVMTFDVVTMLFDFILDDKNVPDAMKALIGRLQIPVLKVAMIDNSVFSKKAHPVRRLLDTLAQVALGWNEDQGQDDPLYTMVESIVGRVAEGFEDDISLFADLLSELEAFATEQQTSAAQREDQSAEGVQGRERLTESRDRANTAVEAGLAGKEAPPAIRDFLYQRWRDVLAFAHIKDGEDCTEWPSAVQTMDDLIWSVDSKAGAEEQRRLVGMLPDLLKRLKQGMSLAGMTKEQATDFLSDLAQLHAAAVHAETRRRATPAEHGHEAEPALSKENHPEVEESGPEGRAISEAFERANKAIYEAARSRPECTGMGTTLVSALFSDDSVTIAHVGDSRLYRLRDGQIEQMTVDHSLLERLIAQGFYTREEAEQSNNKNYVTRAMGIAADEKVDVRREPVLADDIYLLCSDGLSDLVEPEVMSTVLAEPGVNLEALAAHLISLANDAGGKDNISIVLVHVLASFAGEHSGVRNLEEKLEIVAVTDVGRKRSHNEDSVGFDPALGVVILADGMGGSNAGEVASALAVNMMLEQLRGRLGSTGSTLPQPGEADQAGQATGSAQGGIEEIILEGMVAQGLPEDTIDGFNDVAASLEVGSWIEFREDDDNARRARLTWISPTTGTLLFTDRQGRKVAEATARGLAVEFRRGSAVPLGNVPLFDRAVGSLMGRLKATLPAE